MKNLIYDAAHTIKKGEQPRKRWRQRGRKRGREGAKKPQSTKGGERERARVKRRKINELVTVAFANWALRVWSVGVSVYLCMGVQDSHSHYRTHTHTRKYTNTRMQTGGNSSRRCRQTSSFDDLIFWSSNLILLQKYRRVCVCVCVRLRESLVLVCMSVGAPHTLTDTHANSLMENGGV